VQREEVTLTMQVKSNPTPVQRTKVEGIRGQYAIYVRPNGTTFECAYTGSDRRRHFKTLKSTTITAARREASTIIGARNERKDRAPSRLTFGELAEQFFASFEAKVASGERKQRSLDDYRHRWACYLERDLDRVPAQQIDRRHILDILDGLRRQKLSTSTLSAVYRTFARIVSFGNGRGVLSVDVRLGDERITVENAREIRVLTQDEVRAVVEAASPRWKTLIVTAASTGARVSELLGLTFKDLVLEQGNASISITKQLARDGSLCPPKTRNGKRVIEIGNGLRLALLAAYNAAEDKDGFVFASDTEAVGRYGLARRAFTRAVEKSGVPYDPKVERISLHVFRHAAATRLVAAGESIQRVADYLGDTTETVYKVYVHSHRTEGDSNLGALLDSEVAA
jgi:integrase